LNQNHIPYKVVSQSDELMQILIDSNYCLDFNLICVCHNLLASFNEFKSSFNIIIAAGGLVQKNNSELLMIYKNGIWDLPKGKIDKTESAELASIREVSEETNLSKLRILSDYFSTYHIYGEFTDASMMCLKETKWFLMDTSANPDLITPQISEGITQVKWIPFQQIKNFRTYNSIKFLLKSFHIL